MNRRQFLQTAIGTVVFVSIPKQVKKAYAQVCPNSCLPNCFPMTLPAPIIPATYVDKQDRGQPTGIALKRFEVREQTLFEKFISIFER